MSAPQRLLLDTHTLLWWLMDGRALSATARAALADPAGEIHVSSATAWEIATKARKGKLDFPPLEVARLPQIITSGGMLPLPVTLAHAVHAGSYPQSHGDPFDRMLAAQSELEGLTLVTRDPAFAAFGCRTLW